MDVIKKHINAYLYPHSIKTEIKAIPDTATIDKLKVGKKELSHIKIIPKEEISAE